MRILVTGAQGQLGSELKELLSLDKDKDCFFLDRKQLPLDHIMHIQDMLAMYEPDIIIHAAAYTAVDKAETETEMANIVNHLASEEIAQYCRLHGAKLIAISTDYVFDGNSDIPLTEEAETAPISAYGKSKLLGELAIQKWAPDSIIIRTAWVYSTYGNNFVKTMLRLMNERDEISVVDDQIGAPTYARDLAQAIVTIIDSGKWEAGIYHYSNAGRLSWYDFAVAIREFGQQDCKINPIPTSAYPTPAKRPKYSLLDKTKIQQVYAVNVPEWSDSLRQMLSALQVEPYKQNK